MVQAGRLRSGIVAAVVALSAIGWAAEKHNHAHDHGSKKGQKEQKKDAHAHDHSHEAPHNGTLIALGDHFAHLELVLDSSKGKLTAYVLDGEVEKSVRVKQAEIELQITPEGSNTTSTVVRLQASANPLTGETVGSTSEFSGKSDKLKGVKKFSGVVRKLTIKGTELSDVSFKYPEGNE